MPILYQRNLGSLWKSKNVDFGYSDGFGNNRLPVIDEIRTWLWWIYHNYCSAVSEIYAFYRNVGLGYSDWFRCTRLRVCGIRVRGECSASKACGGLTLWPSFRRLPCGTLLRLPQWYASEHPHTFCFPWLFPTPECNQLCSFFHS